MSLAENNNYNNEYNNDIFDFLNFLHENIESKNNVYFGVLQKRGKQVLNKFFNNVESAVNWIDNSDCTLYDTYQTTNEFCCPKREQKYVYTFRALYFDLDGHEINNSVTLEHQINLFIDKLSWYLEYDRILKPNLIVRSGRGIHIYYVFDNDGMPKKKLDWLQRELSERVAIIIKEMLSSIDSENLCLFELDGCYKDAARLLRIPGTINTKVGELCEVLYFNKTKYSPNFIRCFVDIPKPIGVERANFEKPIKKARMVFINRFLNLHKDRLDDLFTLIAIRSYNMNGYRELTLFLVRYYNCFLDINNNEKLVIETNNSFTEPLNDYELNATKSAEKAYYNWLLDKKSGYNYQNKTLISLLHITDEEQQQLKTIISKDEKARRRANKKQWSNNKRDTKRENKKDNTDNKILKMLNQNKTYDYIQEHINVSRDKISSLVNRENKLNNKLAIDNKILDMLITGRTYKEIVEVLNVSKQRISKVKKMVPIV